MNSGNQKKILVQYSELTKFLKKSNRYCFFVYDCICYLFYYYQRLLFFILIQLKMPSKIRININNSSRGIFYKNWSKADSLNITNFQKGIWMKTFSKCLEISTKFTFILQYLQHISKYWNTNIYNLWSHNVNNAREQQISRKYVNCRRTYKFLWGSISCPSP